MNVQDLHKITRSPTWAGRKQAYLDRLDQFDLVEPHRLAHITSQVCHESGQFRYVEEIASGAAYEGRKDLGNTQRGDGRRFKGRDLIQITGRANYTDLTKWTQDTLGVDVDFVAEPELLTSAAWIGVGVVWYFTTRRGLMDAVDGGDLELVTRLINGGLNGYKDRLKYYDRACLVLLGLPNIKAAQTALGTTVDGISGPITRRAMHEALKDGKAN